MKKQKTVLAIPMGDPAGIGPEILLKALAHGMPSDSVTAVVIADRAIMEKTASDCAIGNPFTAVVSTDAECTEAIIHHHIILYDVPLIDISQFSYGMISSMCGKAAYEAVRIAVRITSSGIAQALVTPPLHKEALRAAGVHAIGHTEILGELTDSPSPITMFETLGLKIFFMTRHVSLLQACNLVTEDRVYRTIRECYRLTEHPAFDAALPFAVAALNPHSGEHGLFGEEEQIAIFPAVQRAQERGMNVVGPIGADSVFHLAHIGKYRAVLALYHDQGHIAAKTLDFHRTVSVTWGLPFLRTSVDHGTAFDIAGKGVASSVSMQEAIRVALRYLDSGTERI